MKFITSVIELYDLLLSQESVNSVFKSFSEYMSLIDRNLYAEKLMNNYKNDMNHIIDTKLSFCKDDINYMRKLNEVSWYESSMAIYSCIVIFWAKYNNAGLTEMELSKLSEATFIGVIGYKLIDIHNDEGKFGKEAAIIGNYLIHLYEEILTDVFVNDNPIKVINKYVAMYTEVEFLEKRNRWKSCPFSWDEPEKIGWKAAPLFSIFELLFRKAKVNHENIELKIKGLIYASSALQMADDLMDAAEDLTNGIETLVMDGFFNECGTDKNIDTKLVDNFLTDEKTLKFYDTTQMFYDKAREIYKDTDNILALFLELQNYRFNKTINS